MNKEQLELWRKKELRRLSIIVPTITVFTIIGIPFLYAFYITPIRTYQIEGIVISVFTVTILFTITIISYMMIVFVEPKIVMWFRKIKVDE